MFIQLHALRDNSPIWVNPKAIQMMTFAEGTTTLAVAGGLAMQVVESEAEVRSLIEDFFGGLALIVLQAYS